MNCRPRIHGDAARGLEQVQKSRGISFQAACNLAIDAGLRALGKLPRRAPADESLSGDAILTVAVPGEAREVIRQLARQEFRSKRSMTRIITMAGLRALGAWPPTPISQQ
jgi:hypothetical protein